MSKATPANLQELGFTGEQFGTPGDFDAYLQAVLDDIALEVRGLIGAAVYDAASSGGSDTEKLDFKRLKAVESYLAAAELWRRIEMFERRDAIRGRSDGGTETIGSRALANARAMEERAADELMLFGISTSAGFAAGVNESGSYDAVSG